MIISLSGCLGGEPAKEISLKDVVTIEEPVPENDTKTIKIAVSAIVSPKETFENYRDLLDYISKKLDMPVEMVQRETYAEVNELVKEGELEGAFVCTGSYIQGHEEFGMELIAAPKVHGMSVYYSYIIVNSESTVDSLEDLEGKSFAFTDPLSNTGKLAPTYILALMNQTPDTFFDIYIFTYSHDKSIEAVASKLVDGAAVDSLVWDHLNMVNPELTEKTRIIKKSQPFGIPPFVVPKDLDPELKEKLRDILLHMHEDDEGGEILDKIMVEKFIVIDDGDYDSVREMKSFVEKYDSEK